MKRPFVNNNALYVMVGLVIVALIGVQVYWIMRSVQLQKNELERRLKEDIAKVARDVEEEAYCFKMTSKAFISRGEGFYMVRQKLDKQAQFVGPGQGGYVDTLNLFNLFYEDKDTIFHKEKSIRFINYSATVEVTLKFSFYAANPNIKRRDSSAFDVSNLTANNFKEVLANKVKIDEAIDVELLDTLIHQVLVKNKLKPNYEAGIRKEGEKSFEYLIPGSKPAHLAGTPIKTQLFNDNRFNKPYELLVYIPDSFGRVMRSVSVMMFSSILIIIILVSSYIYFVRTILNQRKLSEMKDTFINNITHEFRTPITNIGLAVENWREGMNNTAFYMQIVEEENKHMERNVEQILQLATLEHDELQNFGRFNMNELIKETIATFKIQLENVGGNIVHQYNAANQYVYADRSQIKNLLYNLVDNSIKYSKGNLLITISTYDINGHFALQVEDNGIGMSADTQKHIFNRFYRGHTGDRHDVKGFGLGLSYVKYIVDVHKGEIYVKSRPGAGTKFTIYLPKTKDEHI